METEDIISVSDIVICIVIPTMIVILFFLFLIWRGNADWEPEDEG